MDVPSVAEAPSAPDPYYTERSKTTGCRATRQRTFYRMTVWEPIAMKGCILLFYAFLYGITGYSLLSILVCISLLVCLCTLYDRRRNTLIFFVLALVFLFSTVLASYEPKLSYPVVSNNASSNSNVFTLSKTVPPSGEHVQFSSRVSSPYVRVQPLILTHIIVICISILYIILALYTEHAQKRFIPFLFKSYYFDRRPTPLWFTGRYRVSFWQVFVGLLGAVLVVTIIHLSLLDFLIGVPFLILFLIGILTWVLLKPESELYPFHPYCSMTGLRRVHPCRTITDTDAYTGWAAEKQQLYKEHQQRQRLSLHHIQSSPATAKTLSPQPCTPPSPSFALAVRTQRYTVVSFYILAAITALVFVSIRLVGLGSGFTVVSDWGLPNASPIRTNQQGIRYRPARQLSFRSFRLLSLTETPVPQQFFYSSSDTAAFKTRETFQQHLTDEHTRLLTPQLLPSGISGDARSLSAIPLNRRDLSIVPNYGGVQPKFQPVNLAVAAGILSAGAEALGFVSFLIALLIALWVTTHCSLLSTAIKDKVAVQSHMYPVEVHCAANDDQIGEPDPSCCVFPCLTVSNAPVSEAADTASCLTQAEVLDGQNAGSTPCVSNEQEALAAENNREPLSYRLSENVCFATTESSKKQQEDNDPFDRDVLITAIDSLDAMLPNDNDIRDIPADTHIVTTTDAGVTSLIASLEDIDTPRLSTFSSHQFGPFFSREPSAFVEIPPEEAPLPDEHDLGDALDRGLGVIQENTLTGMPAKTQSALRAMDSTTQPPPATRTTTHQHKSFVKGTFLAPFSYIWTPRETNKRSFPQFPSVVDH